MTEIEDLRKQWTDLYSKILPQLAKSHDPVQQKWPVTLDHCFARIILDNTIGKGQQQWDTVIKKPAVKQMSTTQLLEAIHLCEKIWSGEADLVELDRISLKCRGKGKGKYGKAEIDETKGMNHNSVQEDMSRKRKRIEEFTGDKKSKTLVQPVKKQSTLSFEPQTSSKSVDVSPGKMKHEKVPTVTQDQLATLHRIQQHDSLTQYRKRLYTILLSVPRGRYTTYAAMSDYLNSSARAVGNGMRRNPLAPEVPCHRVLAADRTLGGFCGDWGKDGMYADKKIELLRGEALDLM